MALELIGGVLLEGAVSELSNGIVLALKKTWYFKSKLRDMRKMIESMKPIFEDMEKLNLELDRRKEETESFMNLLKQAETLVRECQHIKLDLWKRYRYASRLDKMNESLLKFVQTDLHLQNFRNGVQTLVEVKSLKVDLYKASSSGSLSPGVPLEKGVVVGFEDRVRDLKAMVLKDSPGHDCSVVVVSATGGCGKTFLVTKLCHDPEIKRRFGTNIYYVVIPEKYDIKVIIKNLLGRNQPPDFESDDVAVQQWGRFLAENDSEILLVLDDVRSASIINHLKFKSPTYKILVTSRESFNQYKKYQLPVLNDQDATLLFRHSAFSEHENEDSNIPDDLVAKLIKCCKNHPLLLSVIGGLLKGKPVPSWMLMLQKLSKGNRSYSDLHSSIRDCLVKSFYLFEEEPYIKQCYQDLGLFPEDQKIAATTLMDIWAHLYNHDEDGLITMDILTTLSSRNLANLLPVRKHLSAIANHCEEEYVMQHDMMRELAIQLSSQEPPEHRERLILNSDGQGLPKSQETVSAHILSVSIDEGFSLSWNEVQAPNVEVLVLNFMSKIHPLPRIMHTMEKLKVLIITNYGYYFSGIQNFPAPQYLSGLTRIRLDHVSISSIGTTILMLENLQKLSLIMCKIGNGFNEGIPNNLASLLEIDIESCDDLVTFPLTLCDSVCVRKLSITNCHELTSLPEEFEKFSNLEVLRVASCSKFTTLPESITNAKNLRIMDISHCLSLCKLPQNIGELVRLETIVAMGCTGLHELPRSVKNFDKLEVVCDEETSYLWSNFENVKVKKVKEDPLDTFHKIIPREHM